jgi:hypothetical protein
MEEYIMKKTFEHINDCQAALEACKNIDEVNELLDSFPRWSGDWWYSIEVDKNDRAYYVVSNQWYDKNTDSTEVDEYELDIPLSEEDAEELDIDTLYHDADEEELRRMGCFGDDDEEDYFDNDFDPDGRRSEKPWDYSKHYDEEDCFDCFDDEEDEE